MNFFGCDLVCHTEKFEAWEESDAGSQGYFAQSPIVLWLRLGHVPPVALLILGRTVMKFILRLI